VPTIGHYTPNTAPHIPYPSTIPAGGVVTADLEDSSGRPFVSITFPATDERDEVHVSLGGSDEYDDEWSSFEDEPTGLGDDVDEEIATYLRAVQGHVTSSSDAATSAVATASMKGWVAAATEAPAPADHSDEAYTAAAAERGATLIGLHGSDDAELEDNAADAIADILTHLRARGVDTDALVDRAKGYLDED
jgi:hypothetical protein